MPNLCYMKNNTKYSCQMYEKPLSETDPEAAEGVVGYLRYFYKPGLDAEKKYYLPLVAPTDPRATALRAQRQGTVLSPMGTGYIVGNKWVTLVDREYFLMGDGSDIPISLSMNSKVRSVNDINGVNMHIKLTATRDKLAAAALRTYNGCYVRLNGSNQHLNAEVHSVWLWQNYETWEAYCASLQDLTTMYLKTPFYGAVRLFIEYLIKE